MKEANEKKKVNLEKRDIISYRKGCKADGTGLSHYILIDKKGK